MSIQACFRLLSGCARATTRFSSSVSLQRSFCQSTPKTPEEKIARLDNFVMWSHQTQTTRTIDLHDKVVKLEQRVEELQKEVKHQSNKETATIITAAAISLAAGIAIVGTALFGKNHSQVNTPF